MVRKLKIEKGVDIPNWHGAYIPHPYDAVVAKMKPGDSIEFKDANEKQNFYQRAVRYSRREKKNKWMFRGSCINGYRIWRVI